MKFSELIKKVAKEQGLPEKTAKEVLMATFRFTCGALADGESVQITGFGDFYPIDQTAKTKKTDKGKNIHLPACKSIYFKSSKQLKVMLNG